MLYIGILLLVVATCFGHQPYTTTPRPLPGNLSDPGSNPYDVLCSRTHTNTAFVGAQPFSKLLIFSAGDCFKTCIEAYPRCVAVVFYNLHDGDLRNVCYQFDKNSANEDVALVPERPVHPEDTIRCLEVVPDCVDFNPVPPLGDDYVQSTDTVSQSKRVETTSTMSAAKHTLRTGAPGWSHWTQCTPRTSSQIRSQACDYGRLINRRKCSYGSMYPSYRTALVVNANVPYPPMGYHHPECHTTEYDQIMTQHVDQMKQICCVQPEYQQPQQPQPTGTRESIEPTPACVVPVCRQVCEPRPPAEDRYDFNLGDHSQDQTEIFTETDRVPEPMWNAWSEWSICSVTCGFGTQQRFRTCSGAVCAGGVSFEHKRCDDVPAACDTWAEWTVWSACRGTCGYGERTRSRFCHLGRDRCYPGADFEVDTRCPLEPCSEWLQWEQWTPCSATCGPSTKTRMRMCSIPGRCSGPEHEETECEYNPCSEWGQWQEWSYCSETCGFGEQGRHRICMGEYCPGETYETKSCMTAECPEWTQWSPWGMCQGDCGYGIRKRTRECMPQNEGCKGPSVDLESCQMPDDCGKWSTWEEWNQCSAVCDTGIKMRQRACIGPLGSYRCQGPTTEETTCTANQPCNDWTDWSMWSQCSTSCGFGTQMRTRECNGLFCTGPRIEEIKCADELQRPCSAWEDWSVWGPCSVTCGPDGIQERFRQCRYGGDCDGESRQSKSCTGNRPCNSWTQWGQWAGCMPFNHQQNCGQGEKTRKRTCVTSDNYPTYGCAGDETETAVCLDEPCCEWARWAEWTPCDRMCGNGLRKRLRDCKGATPGNQCCKGKSMEEMDCNNGPCPTPTQTVIRVDKKTERKHYNFTAYPEQPCTPKTNCYYPPVQPQPLPTYMPQPQNATNCRWTNWCSWSACPQSCDYGVTRRHRYCVGDNSCICNGASLEKSNCVTNEQCRKKK